MILNCNCMLSFQILFILQVLNLQRLCVLMVQGHENVVDSEDQFDDSVDDDV